MQRVSKSGLFFYGILFMVALPVFSWYWAVSTEHLVTYPVVQSRVLGWILSVSGGVLMVWGMAALKIYGKGLPMNIQPPEFFVIKGPYRLFHHPIYWGFGMLMTGFFILTGSSSGLWLVMPVIILSMIALVMGYEQKFLEKRFPEEKLNAFFEIPDDNHGKPHFSKRIAVVIQVLAVMAAGNYIVNLLTAGTLAFMDSKIEWLGVEGGSFLVADSVIVTLLAPFILNRNSLLREWLIMAYIALGLTFYIALLWPAIGAQYLPGADFIPFDAPAEIFHIFTAPASLLWVILVLFWRQSKRLSALFSLPVLALSFVQVSTSRSWMLALAVSVLVFIVTVQYSGIWLLLRNLSERIANSWKEWVFGKVRIINHGFYVGFGAFAGLLAAGYMTGGNLAWGLLVFGVVVIIISALWAQVIEGSEKLKRPFGYYGGLVGMIFASAVVALLGYNVWVLVGILVVFMPWAQAIGRLRCLVNGCCHGGPVNNKRIGIRYYHHRSRVCGISGLKGELLHPTQLYSIIWLFFIGFLLLVLWNNRFPPSFMLGLYLILTGIGRFVEESYRGEVQTPVMSGLRLYQWTAILSLLIGIGFTFWPADTVNVVPEFSWGTLVAALTGGIVTFFAMGVDFPSSNARFSRLV